MTWTVDDLDVRVAERLCRLAGATGDPALRTLAALAAAAPRGGHVCVDLDRVDEEVELRRAAPDGVGRLEPVALDPLGDRRALLRRAVTTGLARSSAETARITPLVVDDARVYLDRYWSYEDRLRDELVARSEDVRAPADPELVRSVLDVVAAHDPSGPAVDRQRLAVANGLLRPLSVLSGGPGTGKTHTVVSVLVGAVLLAERRGAPVPRVAIAAPTGKAAARLEQAIAEAAAERGLPPSAVEVVAGLRGRTIHGLLGHQRWSPTRFRHDSSDPLPHDLVVVDEASMVPLSLMTKLVEAVRGSATLVLVGDRNQLASVEAGAVLGDVCGPAPRGSSLRLSPRWAEVLAEVTGAPVTDEAAAMPGPGVWDGIVQLERFRRFGADSGIGAVARAVQRVDGGGGQVVSLLSGATVEEGATVDRHDDVELLDADPGPRLPVTLEAVVVAAFAPFVAAVEEAAVASAGTEGDAHFEEAARRALAALDRLRVLCAVREGPLGVRAVGDTVEGWVAASGGIRPAGGWYAGRPVLVTRNDHDLGVMNGDVGVALARGDRLVVAFLLADGSVRSVPATRVADCETVWAMTIHKAQGSQFDHAVVVLPERESAVVTRELVYTGVTRAAERVTVVAAPGRLRDAVERPVRRATGLRERLWPEDTG